MLRLSRLVRAAAGGRCHYQVLGVGPTATTEEIKGAFRERAKATHPDMAGSADSTAVFKDMVDAYRILRDPRRRAEYDRERTRQTRAAYHGRGGGSSQWPTGEGQGLSEETRARMYGYPPPGGGGRRGDGGPADAQAMDPSGLQAQRFAAGIVALFCGLTFLAAGRSGRGENADTDYPTKRPSAKKSVAMNSAAAGQQTNLMAGASMTGEDAAIRSVPGATGKAEAAAMIAKNDEIVRAYWNPFHKTWHRIPEGFEAPAAMDLTAWHKKRSDPVEWSRLLAEGKLSEIIPRGGLKERYLPAWEVFHPMLLHDPHTGKTIQVTNKLPNRTPQASTCDVQF